MCVGDYWLLIMYLNELVLAFNLVFLWIIAGFVSDIFCWLLFAFNLVFEWIIIGF